MRRIRIALLIAAGLFAAAIAFVAIVRLIRRPRADRAWVPTQRIAPRAEVQGEVVRIRGVRDFVWRSPDDFDVRFEDRAYDLSKLDSVGYVVSRFGGVPGLAHAFLTFGFGGDFVAISVEARREVGEVYSPWRGLVGQYELLYVIGSERDLIGLRTNVWNEDVSLYPVRATPAKMRELFTAMVLRAEALAAKPEAYDTLFNSCASNIVDHVDSIAPGRIPLRLGLYLPGFSDRVAYDAGLIDTVLPFERLHEEFAITQRARTVPLDGEFSHRIRRKGGGA